MTVSLYFAEFTLDGGAVWNRITHLAGVRPAEMTEGGAREAVDAHKEACKASKSRLFANAQYRILRCDLPITEELRL